ncbi:MAG: Peptidase M16C associated domain containing protein [Candidatus Magnetoglobus multicellularis str. Araruama]|uniref:Peptidase M16C associated domain containing protein n=1 Tax=Candidatus Magnetoglobus multicellularis str. Araruama TaxID=890399 RepID=A0A1V1PHA7_9BACT|nr:MAG: Peptidase M16C associated domain containing protein [Candidatus Magnetoglobus multicellularis str. Araruama]
MINDKNNPEIVSGMTIQGFVVEQISVIEEMSVICYILKHEKTHARYCHVSNSDDENTFSVAFKTVPIDDTGVAHILEHTALCGSSKYPVRDPFFSMIRRSMKSFMNAFTASDWTMYPFSTQNRKDFYNLMDVYLDATFFPNLTELSFKQEGHRLEFENSGELTFKGVVYNEMKGAMSSPSQILGRGLMNALYPTTTYHFNSGGAPDKIPELTYDAFKAFHQRYYHPSNAFFYSYGNLPLVDHLAYINKAVLSKFNAIDPKTDVPTEPRWDCPKETRRYYPLSSHENPEKKSQVCLAWLLTGIEDAYMVLCFSLLDQILLGNSASPLRKALIESGLGSALSDSTGYDSELRDTMFACGLKDVRVQDADAIEKIIFDVFHDLVKNGIDKELIETAIHQMEFHHKEVTNHPYPYGLKLLLHSCGSWFHNNDPIRPLRIEKDLAKLHDDLATGPFFESLIDKYFIQNTHRVRYILEPDQNMHQKEEEKSQALLQDKTKQLTEKDIERIKKDTSALSDLQNAAEDLSCLPTLTVNDISPGIVTVNHSNDFSDAAISSYDQPTRGIVYLSAVQEMSILPEKHIMNIPLFSFVFTRIGTKDYDYVELARRIDRYTGSLGVSSLIRVPLNNNLLPMSFISLNTKCLKKNILPMFDILNSLYFRSDFSNIRRLKQLLLELKSALESNVVSSGHQYAVGVASRKWTLGRMLDERWHGLSQLKHLKTLTNDLSDKKLEMLAQDLYEMAQLIFSKDLMQLAVIGESDALEQIEQPMKGFQSQIPHSDKNAPLITGLDDSLTQTPRLEAWTTATKISFVAQSFPGVKRSHPDAPVISVISKLLKSLYLHKEIREKGGAYGAFATADLEEGLFHLISYRDPHIQRTLQTYANISEYFTKSEFKDSDIQEAIIQLCSDIDRPDTPASRAKKAFWRKLTGLTDEMRKEFKEKVLSVTRSQVIETAQKYMLDLKNKGTIGVVSNAQRIKRYNNQHKEKFEIHKI